MKKNKFLTSLFMFLTLLATNLQSKTSKKKVQQKGKTSTVSKTLTARKKVSTRKKTVIEKTSSQKAANAKTSAKKTSSVKKTVSKKSTVSKSASLSKGIYTLPAHNKTALLETKMAELRQRHNRVAASGTPLQKKEASIEKKLLASFSRWRGTRYAWGGDSKNGIDCSALTRRIYREVFGYELPRVSTQQVTKGRRVSLKNLKPGDILFFRPEGRTNHTTVYIGNSLFINASSSKGVVISSLKSPYWAKYVKYAVRVDT